MVDRMLKSSYYPMYLCMCVRFGASDRPQETDTVHCDAHVTGPPGPGQHTAERFGHHPRPAVPQAGLWSFCCHGNHW